MGFPYQVGPYTIVPEDFVDGSCCADVFLDTTWVGSCAATDRMGLEQQAIQVAMTHHKRMEATAQRERGTPGAT